MQKEAKRRLLRELRRLQNEKPDGVTAVPTDGHLMNWHAVILGPQETIWEGGTFNLKLEFGNEYPYRPPVARFLTPIIHPNVYADGLLCMDLLDKNWKPVYTIAAVLISIRSLLNDPNPYSPANAAAAELYVQNRLEYNRMVQECVKRTYVAITDESSKCTKTGGNVNALSESVVPENTDEISQTISSPSHIVSSESNVPSQSSGLPNISISTDHCTK